MKTFRNFIKDEFNIEMPKDNIPGSWFAENHLPMILACSCCGMTMSSPSAMIDNEGYAFCGGCADTGDEF